MARHSDLGISWIAMSQLHLDLLVLIIMAVVKIRNSARGHSIFVSCRQASATQLLTISHFGMTYSPKYNVVFGDQSGESHHSAR